MSISPASGGASGATISGITNSIAVHILSTAGTIQVKTDPSSVLSGITSSIGVYFDRGNPTVTANAGTGTFNVQFDPGHTLGIIKSIAETVAVYFDRGDPGVKLTSGTLTGITNSIAVVNFTPAGSVLTDEAFDAMRVKVVGIEPAASIQIVGITSSIGIYFDRGNPTITANAGTGTMAVKFDPGYTLGKVDAGVGTFTVKFDPGYTLGSIQNINNSVAVHVLSTNGTMAVNIGTIAGTAAVYFSPNAPTVKREKATTGTFNKIAVVTTARQVVASNASRISVSLVHDSSNTMYIGLANTVTSAYAGNGFPILANQIFVIDDYTGAVFAVHETGESNIKFIEV